MFIPHRFGFVKPVRLVLFFFWFDKSDFVVIVAETVTLTVIVILCKN